MTVLSFTPGLPHPGSPGEQLLHTAHRVGLLHGPWEFNVPVLGRYADLVNTRDRIIVEVDGDTWHSGQVPYTRDVIRDRELQDHGWMVRRYTHAHVTDTAGVVIADINAAVARRQLEQSATANAAAQINMLTHDLTAARHTVAALSVQAAAAARANNPRLAVHDLLTQIARYLANTTNRAAGSWMKTLNATVKRDFGPAAQRSDADHHAALIAMTDWWTRYRAEHGVSVADVPTNTSPFCTHCHEWTTPAHPHSRCPTAN